MPLRAGAIDVYSCQREAWPGLDSWWTGDLNDLNRWWCHYMPLRGKTDESTNTRTLLAQTNPRVINNRYRTVDDDGVLLCHKQPTSVPSCFRDGQTDLQGILPDTQTFKFLACLNRGRVGLD